MEIVGQRAGQRLDQIVAPVLAKLDVEDVDLEHVAGFGAADGDRAGQDVPGHHPLALGMDVVELRRDVEFASIGHHIGAAADGLDRDLVAARYREDRLQLGFEKAPMAGFGAGFQVMMGHVTAFDWFPSSV